MWLKSCIITARTRVPICAYLWWWILSRWIRKKDNFSNSLSGNFLFSASDTKCFLLKIYIPPGHLPPHLNGILCPLVFFSLFTSTFIHFSELTSSDEQTCNDLTSCKNQCPKNLAACGHRCPSLCHAGACPSPKTCSKKTAVRCPCRRKKKVSLFLI